MAMAKSSEGRRLAG